MAGIVFYGTKGLDKIVSFYLRKIGCQVWLKQEDCTILGHDNFIFGFCRREKIDSSGIITFFYDDRNEVDKMYYQFRESAEHPPLFNEKYGIYHFFADDPEGRRLEFQHFDYAVEPFISGERLLKSRRSQRSFKISPVSNELIDQIIDSCRFAPSSHNRQPCYYRVIRDRDKIYQLSNVRGSSSAPIAKAPLAVAIVSDPAISQRHIQDGCIGAYHFLLAARSYGLGTCWIADMDRFEVKEILKIPQDHYIATVTPLGYPEQTVKNPPPRKPLNWFLREK